MIPAFLLSFFIACILTPIVIWVYRKKGWVDDPNKESHPKVIHDRPVPRGGGLVIFAALGISTLLILPLNQQLVGILIGAAILAAIGFIDDIKNLSPYLRLPLLLLPAIAVVQSGIGIDFVSNPFGSGVIMLDKPQLQFMLLGSSYTISFLADFLAIFWIIWSMTIVNWSKGLDGQMPGFVGIAAIVIGVLSLRFIGDPTQINVLGLAMIVAGAFFGFLLWNMYPQKIMAGYGAGSLAGYLLAVLAILSGAKVATAILVLAIPTIDAIMVISRRISSGKSPLWGDRGHLHHRLFDLGWGKRRIAFFYWISTALLGLLALQLNSQQKFYTIVGVFALVGGFIAWLTLFFSYSKRRDRVSG